VNLDERVRSDHPLFDVKILIALSDRERGIKARVVYGRGRCHRSGYGIRSGGSRWWRSAAQVAWFQGWSREITIVAMPSPEQEPATLGGASPRAEARGRALAPTQRETWPPWAGGVQRPGRSLKQRLGCANTQHTENLLSAVGFRTIIATRRIVHGKPVNFLTVPAFFGVFVLNRLPRLHHPLFDHEPFMRVTNDAFFLVIESVDPKFSEATTRDFLEGIGGRDVTVLYAND
jgi:hypothetical protein